MMGLLIIVILVIYIFNLKDKIAGLEKKIRNWKIK